jgi:alpha-N-acetylglucosaminidase
MARLSIPALVCAGSLCTASAFASLDVEAARALIERVVPDHDEQFVVEELQTDGRDAFEIESRDGRIVLRGNNGVSVASALNHYLRHVTNSDISWSGTNLDLPGQLPPVDELIRRESPYQVRYHLNYTTYNYTMTWWDWERWQWEIDWMAMHGINMPLALTGQDAVWQRVYRRLGFTDEQLSQFFSGPAYQSWQWLGLLDGWGGPLPQSWIDGQEELQKRILARQRSLGMKPILPAFIGHVPADYAEKFPDAQLTQIKWTAFDNAVMLHPDDPMFVTIGNMFVEEQTRTFGTDHYYTADAFIEVKPPTNDPEYLAKLGKTIHDSMAGADPDAVWVMQGWMFHFLRDFWQLPQVEAFLSDIPDDGVVILDLWTEMRPVWNRVEAYFGKPWLWCMVHNFGGNNNMFGVMPMLARGPAETLRDPSSGNMIGIGVTSESLQQNPAVYDLFLDNSWTDEPINLSEWLDAYVHRRYGTTNEKVRHAWTVLRYTSYGYDNFDLPVSGPRSALTMVPTLRDSDPRDIAESYYDPIDLLHAWRLLVEASHEIEPTSGFEYDIVDVTRQVMADYSNVLKRRYNAAYAARNLPAMDQTSREILELIDDMEAVVATREEFLLGRWIREARAWGTNEEEADLYEVNTRNLLTLWHGPEHDRLVDYSCRQWSGMLSGVYRPRWEHFFEVTRKAIEDPDFEYDRDTFRQQVRDMDWEWIHQTQPYPAEPQGDPVEAVQAAFAKYHDLIEQRYREARFEVQLENAQFREIGF